MSQASTATNTFKLPEKLNMAGPTPAPRARPALLVFHRPPPPVPHRATATPAQDQSHCQRPARLPLAAAGAVVGEVLGADAAPSGPGWNTSARFAAQTAAVTRRCGPSQPESPGVASWIPAAALGCPPARATWAVSSPAPQKNDQNLSLLS